jgi:type VI secretion system protein ImpK
MGDAHAITSFERSVRDLSERIRLVNAIALARAGRFGDAESILGTLVAEGRSRTALDLLARIRAQQGRLSEADSLWGRLLEAWPDDEGARCAREKIRRVLGRRALAVSTWAPLAVVATASLLAVFWWAQARRSTDHPHVVTVGASEAIASVPPAMPNLAAIVGVTVDASGSETLVSFDQGLFSRGDRLTTQARTTLAALAGALATTPVPFTMTIVGVTNDLSLLPNAPWPDNHALAEARARAAASFLRSQGVPDHSILATAGTSESAPFPNDGPVNRARNRTIMARVRFGGDPEANRP